MLAIAVAAIGMFAALGTIGAIAGGKYQPAPEAIALGFYNESKVLVRMLWLQELDSGQ